MSWTPHPLPRHRVRRLAAAAAVTGLVALTGCSTSETASGGSESADDGGSLNAVAEQPLSRGASKIADAAVVDAPGAETAASAAPSQLVIRTGQVSLTSEDLNAARDGVERLVRRYGGYLADERTVNDELGRTQRTDVELRVPADSFRPLLEDLEEVGEVQRATTKEEDVTTEVIDVESRIRTQEVSLRRLRGFLGDAGNVTSMIRLESEIARREADLASLRAQQDYLGDQTSLSTIRLTMQSSEEPPRKKDRLEDAGFLAGLSNGWNALLGVLLVAATLMGALTPFAVLLAVLGVPAWLWLRASRRQRRPVAPEPAGPTT